MRGRLEWKRHVAICAAILCLAASTSWGSDKKKSQSNQTRALRKAVLVRFDANNNGRLDYKEKAQALRQLSNPTTSDDELRSLRAQILSQFDKNGNGKLERSEIRTALGSVNPKTQAAANSQSASTSGSVANSVARSRAAAAIARDPSAAVAFTAQQLTATGVDAATAEQLAINRFDLNGDGVLDSSELALAQAALLKQLAQASSLTSTLGTTSAVTSIPLVTTTTTGTTGTTGTTSSSTGSMANGCSGSGTGSGSSGTTSSTGQTAGTTNSLANNAANAAANNQGFGSRSFAAARSRGFGGGRGR